MKKIISSVLAVSIFASGFFIDSGLTSTTRANASDAPLVSSITDLSQYPANDVIVVYKKDSNATKKKTLKICSLEESQEEQATISSLTSNSVILKLDSEDALEQAKLEGKITTDLISQILMAQNFSMPAGSSL